MNNLKWVWSHNLMWVSPTLLNASMENQTKPLKFGEVGNTKEKLMLLKMLWIKERKSLFNQCFLFYSFRTGQCTILCKTLNSPFNNTISLAKVSFMDPLWWPYSGIVFNDTTFSWKSTTPHSKTIALAHHHGVQYNIPIDFILLDW